MVLPLSGRKRELVTGFLVLGIMALGWGVGEALLRFVQRGQFGTAAHVERSVQFYRDQQTGLRLPVPNSTQGKIRLNSLGFRSPEIAVPKPPGSAVDFFVHQLCANSSQRAKSCAVAVEATIYPGAMRNPQEV
jgi:hypothetical protein